MNCQNCNNLLPAPQGKFCSYCGAQTVPAPPVQQSMQQSAFQPHFQQTEKKSTPAWVIVLIVAALLFLLALCCVSAFVIADRQGIFDEPALAIVDDEIDYGEEDGVATLEDRMTILAESHDLYAVPTDEEIVAFLEDAHGIGFEIQFSERNPDHSFLALRALYDDYPDLTFSVLLSDISTGELLPLGELRDDFVFTLAGRTVQEIFDLLVEDLFDAENIEWTSTHYSGVINHFNLPIGLSWDSSTGTSGLQQLLSNEFEDELHLGAAVALCEVCDIKDVSWEQLERLAETITEAGINGVNSTLSIMVPVDGNHWGGDVREIYWHTQDGRVYSVNRHER